MNPLVSSKKNYWLVLFIMILTGCEKQNYDYQIPSGKDIKIDSVAFSTGSPTLIADGQSALSFIIQSYSRQTVTIDSKPIDSMVLIPADRLPESSVRVLDESGATVGTKFSTTTATPASKSFHAEVNGVSSETKTVTIVAPGDGYSKIKIPVIFHVFELSKLDSKHYPWYANLGKDKLQALVTGLNAIFNREGTNTPMGATANVEFVMATETPEGKMLATPGYDTYEYNSTFDWGWATYNAAELVKANAERLFWNPKKYLNIWVLPSAVFYGGITTTQPAYTLSDSTLEGLNLQKVASADEVPMTEPESVGMMIGRDEFNSVLRGPATNLAYRFGTFYGLFHTYTYWWDPASTDYCADTRKFDINQYQQIYKVTPDNIIFSADNVMDATFLDYNVEGGQNIVSSLNTLTADQIRRIRYTLENCPERMSWK